jgi:dihydropteroate synthase
MTDPSARFWRLSRAELVYDVRTLVMGVLNITPNSFSDGGRFFSLQRALERAEEMIAEGADLIDVGGESTRPGAAAVPAEEEMRRVIPVIETLANNNTVPISIDTTKATVARAALDAGAQLVNDISGLRFDQTLADEVAQARAGLILMHSRGTPETMQKLAPVDNVLSDVIQGLQQSVATAEQHGVARDAIAIDPGIGFGKTANQNLEIITGLDLLRRAFSEFPLVIGTSRKSFIGHLLGEVPVEQRLHGTMASVTAAILNGAHVVRVHDVKAAVETVRVADAVKSFH